eukprot:5559227-Pyramimonas_sp.AAC.1
MEGGVRGAAQGAGVVEVRGLQGELERRPVASFPPRPPLHEDQEVRQERVRPSHADGRPRPGL